MKKKFIYIVLVMTCSCLVIFYLVLRVDYEVKNGFTRKFNTINLSFDRELEISNKPFGFVTETDGGLILNFPLDRLNLFTINAVLTKVDTIKINYPTAFHSQAINVYKDAFLPIIFCTNPYGDIFISNRMGKQYLKFSQFRFDFFKAIAPQTIVVRGRYNYKDQVNRQLAKLSLTDSAKTVVQYPLPNVANGFFANDGILQFDKKTKRILYMYFYRGEILSLDTNLKLVLKCKTIDTVLHPAIKIGELSSHYRTNQKKIITQKEPPKFVNTYMTTFDGKIYVLSHLKADNESTANFKNNQVVDVYEIYDGSYQYSFYIPKYEGEKLDQLQVNQNNITGIYGSKLVLYKIGRGSSKNKNYTKIEASYEPPSPCLDKFTIRLVF